MRHVGISDLLDREAELECVRRLLNEAKTGSGALLLIEGEPGIGKTSLIQVSMELAKEQGAQVLAARGGELEQNLPFGVVRELLASFAFSELGERTAVLSGAAALAEPALTAAPDGPEQVDSFSVLHGLYWLTAGLAARGPVLLVVDDAQWCDNPSLRFLNYLVRRLDSLPIVILVAALSNTDESTRELLASLAAEPYSEVLRLQQLRRSAVGKLLAHEMGVTADPEFVEACRSATCGNPFLLRELAAEILALGVRPLAREAPEIAALAPRSVRQITRRRLGRLPEAAGQLARAAAVLGDSADLSCVAALAGVPRPRAGMLADELIQAGLLVHEPGLTFVQPIIRAAIYRSIGPAELAAAHRRAADLLISAGQPTDVVMPHLLAGETRSDQSTVELLVNEATVARARGAPETAVCYLKRAIVEPPHSGRRAEVLLQLGLVEASLGLAEAVNHLESCVEESTDPVCRARAHLALAKAYMMAGRIVDTVETCRRGIDELGDVLPELALELEAERFSAGRHELSMRPVVAKVLGFKTGQATSGSRAESILFANLAMDEACNLGSRDRVIERAEAALEHEWLFEPDALATLPTAILSLAVSGRARQARQYWDEAMARHQARGDARGYALGAAFRGYTAYLLGDLDAAVADGRSGLDLAREHNMVLVETNAVAWLVLALTESGDLDAAEKELMDHATRRNPATARATNSLLSASGQLRLAQGRLDESVSNFRECERSHAAWGMSNPFLCPYLTQLAEALNRLGQLAEAAEYSNAALRLARKWGAPGPIADALRVIGLISGGKGGCATLQEASAFAETAGSPLEHARVLVSLGVVLRRSGRPREAREPLRTAMDLASGCGAGTIVKLANQELVASGAQPRRLRTTGVDSLTATERRVALMAAGGLTNRATAQALFVSEKTIETHLAHTYRKLGITSRSQLAMMLADETLLFS
jgi:DNA-binding CsgD family transcriptional regulator